MVIDCTHLSNRGMAKAAIVLVLTSVVCAVALAALACPQSRLGQAFPRAASATTAFLTSVAVISLTTLLLLNRTGGAAPDPVAPPSPNNPSPQSPIAQPLVAPTPSPTGPAPAPVAPTPPAIPEPLHIFSPLEHLRLRRAGDPLSNNPEAKKLQKRIPTYNKEARLGKRQQIRGGAEAFKRDLDAFVEKRCEHVDSSIALQALSTFYTEQIDRYNQELEKYPDSEKLKVLALVPIHFTIFNHIPNLQEFGQQLVRKETPKINFSGFSKNVLKMFREEFINSHSTDQNLAKQLHAPTHAQKLIADEQKLITDIESLVPQIKSAADMRAVFEYFGSQQNSGMFYEELLALSEAWPHLDIYLNEEPSTSLQDKTFALERFAELLPTDLTKALKDRMNILVNSNSDELLVTYQIHMINDKPLSARINAAHRMILRKQGLEVADTFTVLDWSKVEMITDNDAAIADVLRYT